MLAVDEGKAVETKLLLKGVTAANFTEADEIAAKGVFAEAVDANLEDVVLIARDSVSEEATLAKAPKDGAAVQIESERGGVVKPIYCTPRRRARFGAI